MSNEAIAIVGPTATAHAGLLAMRAAILLESKGMKRSRGVSTTHSARQMGIVKSRSAAKALGEIEAYIIQHAKDHGFPEPNFCK